MRQSILAVAFLAVVCAQVPPNSPANAPTNNPANTGRRGRQAQPQTKVSELETPVATFHGTLKSLSKKEVVLAMPEDQSIVFHVSHKTKFLKDGKPIKPAAIPADATLTVDGKRDLLGNVEAVSVTVDAGRKPAGPAGEGAATGGGAAPPR
jgi:hypothetical protein